MDSNLQDLIKEMLASLALICCGFYVKIAKDKEPHATKSMWKILIAIGLIGFILSLMRYLMKI